MENDNSAINDLVTKTAEEIKVKENENTGDNQQQQNEKDKVVDEGTSAAASGSEPSEEEKAAALKLAEETAAKATEEETKLNAIKAEAQKELLKKFNVETVEELEEKFSKKEVKVLTEEEKKKEDEIYEAKLKLFAVEKGLGKSEDFDQLKTLKSKQDAELVFEDYLKDWKEDNPDVKEDEDTTAADIEKLAKEDFEKEYKLNSTSEKVKAKGIARLAREAADKRSPLEDTYNDAKEQFDEATDLRDNFPKFVKGLEGIAKEVVPEKIEWFRGKDGEEELPPIEIPLSDDDRKEILEKVAKRLERPENYKLFKEGKLDTLKEGISEYADYLVSKKTREMGNNKIAEYFLGRGIEKGSKVGAENSFATNQAKQGAHQKDKLSTTDAAQQVLNQPAFKK